MLNPGDDKVLSYLRKGPGGVASVVVAINVAAEPRPVTFDGSPAGVSFKAVRTLATTDSSLQGVTSLKSLTLPPFSVWVGSVQ